MVKPRVTNHKFKTTPIDIMERYIPSGNYIIAGLRARGSPNMIDGTAKSQHARYAWQLIGDDPQPETVDRLWRAILKLDSLPISGSPNPTSHALVILAIDLVGMTHEMVAEELGKSRATITRVRQTALRRIKELMQDDLDKETGE